MMQPETESVLTEYINESTELLQRISLNLQQMEKATADVDLDAIYRDIHTLKGTSQLFGFKPIAELAHAMENCMDPIRQQRRVPDKEVSECLLMGLDLIEESFKSLQKTGSAPTPKGQAECISRLNHFAKSVVVAQPPAATVAPKSPEAIANPIQAAPPVTSGHGSSGNAPPASGGSSSEQLETSSIRVPVGILDRLMNLMGEMVLVRNQVLQFSNQRDEYELLNLSQRLDTVTSEIQNEVMKTRMQPIGQVLNKFHRIVRDLARDLNKKIELTIEGAETELDKGLLETIKDPIMHIIRNACDHGLEAPQDRKKANKPEAGHISIRAYHEGGHVLVEIQDDGRGLNRQRIIAKAIERGLITPAQSTNMSDREVSHLIFAPGFSTASEVTNVSGRGVGMDVVKNNLDQIGGFVDVSSKEGHGTTFLLRIPLTLAIVPALIVKSKGSRFVIPQIKLNELIRIDPEEKDGPKIEWLSGRMVFRLRGQLIPVVHLTDVFSDADYQTLGKICVHIVVLKTEQSSFGLIVDEILDTSEIVVKPLSSLLKRCAIYSGATILGDGSIGLILDPSGIAVKGNALQLKSESNRANLNSTDSKNSFHEVQDFLLVKLQANSLHAIPLNLVERIEEFSTKSIEYSGTSPVVAYRGRALPLISLNVALEYTEKLDLAKYEKLSVIIIQRSGIDFGLVVDEVVNVMETTADLTESAQSHPGLLGNFIHQDQIIVVVDALQTLDRFRKPTSSGPQNLGSLGSSSNVLEKPAQLSGHVLFAEDTIFFQKHIVNLLTKNGLKVTLARDGGEALDILNSAAPGHFDLVLSDIEMPRMNGLDLARNIRKNSAHQELPLIAITTRFSAEHVKSGLDAGFTWYLEKLNPEVLLSHIQQALTSKPKADLTSEKLGSPAPDADATESHGESDLDLMASTLTLERKSVLLETIKCCGESTDANVLAERLKSLFQQIHELKGLFALSNHRQLMASCQDLENEALEALNNPQTLIDGTARKLFCQYMIIGTEYVWNCTAENAEDYYVLWKSQQEPSKQRSA
jgi:two-component system chemotaxis sensor kinase CheA